MPGLRSRAGIRTQGFIHVSQEDNQLVTFSAPVSSSVMWNTSSMLSCGAKALSFDHEEISVQCGIGCHVLGYPPPALGI